VRTTLVMLLITAGVVDGSPIAADPATLAFESRRAGEVLVPVVVNGRGPFPFLLDTGSTHSAIADDLADELGARAVAKSLMSTPSGEELTPVVHIDRLLLGPSVDREIFASLLPRRALDPTGLVAGIVGQDVLANRHYTIDFVRRCIAWHRDVAGPASTRAVTLSLAFEQGRFLVDLPQGRSRLRLVPDSGAQAMVFFDRGGALPPLVPTGEHLEMATLTSVRTVAQMQLAALAVGAVTLHRVPAVVIVRDDPGHSDADGLLPLHLFTRVTLDGPGLKVTLEP
jgi:hypothetical protein